jgi:hypothetical protein
MAKINKVIIIHLNLNNYKKKRVFLYIIAVGQIARQLIQCGRLGQFRLASRLLYSG